MALQSIETSASSLESAGIPEPGHLVVHLIAAKRSLSSTSQVYRANELVSQSRLQLEQIVITGARNDFLQNALRKQLRTVHDAKQALRKIKANVGVDFKVRKRRGDIDLSRRIQAPISIDVVLVFLGVSSVLATLVGPGFCTSKCYV